MQRGRAALMVAGLMAGLGAAAVAQGETVRLQATSDRLPMFHAQNGRGKNKTRTHDNGGTRAYQRAAMKKRNKARHRKACR